MTSTSSPLTENKFAASDRRLVERILAAYNLHAAQVLPPQKGYRNQSFPILLNDGQKINLILYKIEPGIVTRIKNANRVADYAATHGLPARRTFRPNIIRLTNGAQEKFGCLYEYLPGDTIPWEAYTRAHLKVLGHTMGELHHVLQGVSVAPTVTDEYTSALMRMQRYFCDAAVQQAIRTKLQVTLPQTIFANNLRLLKICEKLPGQQTLHMDFVRGNILFQNSAVQAPWPTEPPADWRHPRQRRPHPRGLNESAGGLVGQGAVYEKNLHISGILDFEKTAHGHRLFDLARTLAFLLVDCKYKSEADIYRFFIESGYCTRGRMPRPHAELLEALTNLFLLHDFYKFLRHNPYESLAHNEHYLRTRDLLIKKRLLR